MTGRELDWEAVADAVTTHDQQRERAAWRGLNAAAQADDQAALEAVLHALVHDACLLEDEDDQ